MNSTTSLSFLCFTENRKHCRIVSYDMRLLIILLLVGLLFIYAQKKNEPLRAVETLDLVEYQGTWYEIAKIPDKLETELGCITYSYKLEENEYLSITSTGIDKEQNKIKKFKGKAWIPDEAEPSRMKVQFLWPFTTDFYVISLDKKYNFSMVGDPSRKSLSILSRKPFLDKKTYDSLLYIARDAGYNIDKIKRIPQGCN